jgi:hypothetical protein
MFMSRARTIVVVASFADEQALLPFERFIDHYLYSAAYLHKRFDSEAQQTTTQLHRRPTRTIEQTVILTEMGRLF